MTPAILAILGLAAFAVVWALVAGWRRAMRVQRPLLLGAMLMRQGPNLSQLSSLHGRELGRAVRRCMLCGSAERCSSWLQQGGREGFDAFCPNAGYIEELKRIRL